MPGLAAAEPRDDQGSARLDQPVRQDQRPAAEQDQDQLSARSDNLAREIELRLRQRRIGATPRLPAHAARFAEAEQDRVRSARRAFRIGQYRRICFVDAATLDVQDAFARPRTVKRIDERDALVLIAQSAPGSEHIGVRIGKRSDDRNGSDASVQRQRRIAVLHQHAGSRRRLPRKRAAPKTDFMRRMRRLAGAIGLIEQAELEFQLQHAPHAAVDVLHRHETSLQRAPQAFQIREAHHVDIDAGVQRERRCFDQIGRHSMRDEFGDPGVIAHHDPVETPFAPHDSIDEIAVRMHRHAGDIGKGRHDGERASVHRRLERGQIDFAQRALRHVHLRVFTPGVDEPVGGEMFRSRGDIAAMRSAAILVGAHLRVRVARANMRVFAGRLGDAAPARIACDVEHRGKSEV